MSDARSMAQIDDADLDRLGRVADADLERFFERNPHLQDWRERLVAVALAQGGAEHRIRGRRGIWDLDVIVCFASPDARLKTASQADRALGLGAFEVWPLPV